MDRFMSVGRIIFICFTALFSLQVMAVDSGDLLPPGEAFQLSAAADGGGEILLQWEIADGYYLYRNKITAISLSPPVELAAPAFPKGIVKQDKYFGEVEIYQNALRLPVPVKNAGSNERITIQVTHQGCADIGICYPPQKTRLDIALPGPPAAGGNPVSRLFESFQGLRLNLFQDELLPPDQAFRFNPVVVDGTTLRASWEIADGYYLYREKTVLSLQDSTGTRLGSYVIPAGIPMHDEAFGEVQVFYGQLAFSVPLLRSNTAAQSITLVAEFQGCAERGVCYPPMSKSVVLELPALQQAAAASPAEAPKAASGLSELDEIIQALHQDTLWLTLVSFFSFGLLLSFTPCIFPMIPILSGIIVGQGRDITTRRAFFLSLTYVFASALTYTGFGITAALFGSNLQAAFQQPWVIILFSAVFVLLALSMFGFYALELPKTLQARIHHSSEKHHDGSIYGTALMGALSALIVGPCVAAPLAGALIYSGQTGDAVLGGLALFMMGMGMGMPLLLIGASAGKLLPKAGTWLNSTKAVFGVIMLAVAVWMLERILPAAVTMLLLSMLLIIPAIYLSAIDPLPPDASGWHKLWKGVGLMMLTYGVLLLIGLGMGQTNPLRPLQGVPLGTAAAESSLAFQRVASLPELQERLRQAQRNGQWVMLDYYADWCITCKEMESGAFADPEVKRQLAGVMLLQADVTENSPADKALLQKFSLIGPPAILFFGPDRQERAEFRIIGYQDTEEFLAHLQRIPL